MNLRQWQSEAIQRVESAGYRGMVRAVMGAGKSVCMAELIRRAPSDWRVVVSAPTIKLVRQLSGTLRDIVGEPVGQVYTHAHHVERITVCCHPSLERLPWDLTPDLWIADEAHRTESPEVLAWDAFAGAARKLGFSATPWGKPLTLYEDLLYNYSARDALKDGVVVPWKIVHPQQDEYDNGDEACLDMIRGMEGPGVVNAISILDADNYADWLTRRGIPAMPVHSAIPDGGARSIERLEAGELRCVVHVNMLAEGVDLPWLRWLCLRRPTSNPVRFAQEVGRALRSYPGKKYASILDPHDLFGQFRLDEEAMLGGGPIEKKTAQPDEIAQQMRLDTDLWEPPYMPIESIPRVRSYLRRIVTAMDAAGLVESKVASRHWRDRPASAKQVKWASGMRFSKAPQPHRDVLCRIAERCATMPRGDVSDLITVFTGLKRGWPDFDRLYS